MNNEPTPTTLSEELESEMERLFPFTGGFVDRAYVNHSRGLWLQGAQSPIAKRIARKGYISVEEHERQMKEFAKHCVRECGFDMAKVLTDKDYKPRTFDDMVTQFKSNQKGGE